MKFAMTYHGHREVYEAEVVARKFNGYCTAFPSTIDGVIVKRPNDALDTYFICDDDLEIIEVTEREKNMEVEL